MPASGHRLLSGVDQIGVDGLLGGERPHAEQAIFGLQVHLHAVGHEVGHQGGHADAEVHVEAVLQFAGGTFGDSCAVQRHGRGL